MGEQLTPLLNVFQKMAGCNFLSDLHGISFSPEVKKDLLELPDKTYTLKEWNKAAAYITNRPCEFNTIQEVKNYIIEMK